MKYLNLSILTFIPLFLLSCGQQNSYKEQRAEVMKLHDEVMAKNDLVVHQQMKLDSLLKDLNRLKGLNPKLDTATSRQGLQDLRKGLEEAEDKMNQWMQGFDPDTEGKNNDAATAYFEGEKKKLKSIDSLYDLRTKATEEYLNKMNIQR